MAALLNMSKAENNNPVTIIGGMDLNGTEI
jgi:hypothetical protein